MTVSTAAKAARSTCDQGRSSARKKKVCTGPTVRSLPASFFNSSANDQSGVKFGASGTSENREIPLQTNLAKHARVLSGDHGLQTNWSHALRLRAIEGDRQD